MGSPILPTNPADPGGIDRRERGAMNEMGKRVRRCGKAYRDALSQIQFLAVNVERYEFLTSVDAIDLLLADLARIVDTTMNEGGRWLFTGYVRPAYQQGTAKANASIANQSKLYADARSLEQLLTSPPYLKRLSLLRGRLFEKMEGITADVQQTLASTLTQGLADGVGPLEISKRITESTGIVERRANNIARTETGEALREGRLAETEDARSIGVNVGVMHLSALSPTTRISHARRHGGIFSVQEERAWYAQDGNRYNCYLPGTRVAGRFIAGSKARYEGPAVRLVTASGYDLRVTPNHPVMTARGLLPAAELRKGDHLVTHRPQVEAPAGGGDLYGQLREAPIEEVFCSLVDLGHSLFVGVTAVDFHGDAAHIEEDIHVVVADRVLPLAVDARLAQCLDEFKFVLADSAAGGQGSQALSFRRIDSTPTSLVGGSGDGEFAATLPQQRGPGTTSRPYPAFGKPSVQCNSRHASLSADLLDRDPALVPGDQGVNIEPVGKLRGEVLKSQPTFVEKPLVERPAGHVGGISDLLERHSATAQINEVIEVSEFSFSGHVYDLEELSGLMIANGVMASNCKCSPSEILLNDDGTPAFPDVVKRTQAARARFVETAEKGKAR